MYLFFVLFCALKLGDFKDFRAITYNFSPKKKQMRASEPLSSSLRYCRARCLQIKGAEVYFGSRFVENSINNQLSQDRKDVEKGLTEKGYSVHRGQEAESKNWEGS